MNLLQGIKNDLRLVARKGQGETLARFFKTGKGQYGEGDLFLGVRVPQSRIIVKKYRMLSFGEIEKLLNSRFHEERLVAILILVGQYQQGDKEVRAKIFMFYQEHLARINNWDLVDVSAPHIVGTHLFSAPKKMRASFLSSLAHSQNLWERRIAIVSTLSFIRQGDFISTLTIAKLLVNDPEDLIHKATGWMLREVGKREVATLEYFLQEENRYRTMPRTMLRYAIEHFPEAKRKKYLSDIL
ncbi:DNA alkylation repair protein [Candidatus Nomurabacteria bacterium CG1_02_43_90]|uniref:DNA alkylation repair protein n=1 Tax=Candidatus Nomurabacteria bacterium CG1_02_43_90 TaxID=1805281 RepID=A0A1J4V6U6_9BACT|nr:MAG: DNA alkylation repair protein [Candidatus Nomurabacteria bacterium CG1_02_43_90]